eukprot:763327-Hanusia_phi.AAC.4
MLLCPAIFFSDPPRKTGEQSFGKQDSASETKEALDSCIRQLDLISLKNNQDGTSKLSSPMPELPDDHENKAETSGAPTNNKQRSRFHLICIGFQSNSLQPDMVATDRAVATLGLAMRKLQKELKMLGNELRGSTKSPRPDVQSQASGAYDVGDCLNSSNVDSCNASISSLRVCPGTAKKGQQEWRVSSDFTQELEVSVQEDSPSRPCASEEISEATALQHELQGRTAGQLSCQTTMN